MERMEVEQCAGAGGGVPLRRSNSAPMITSLSDSSVVFQPFGSRCRRSSVSLNLGCPGLPFTLSPLRTPCHHSQEAIRQQAGLTGTYPRGVGQSREAPPTLQPSSSWPSPYNLEHRGPHSRGENPSSSSLCAPNFDRTIARLGLQPFAQTPLKRKVSECWWTETAQLIYLLNQNHLARTLSSYRLHQPLAFSCQIPTSEASDQPPHPPILHSDMIAANVGHLVLCCKESHT
ncbi:uncharacterized protein LOC144797839 isoform X1 [Lissotriton helveticus]